MSNSGDEVLKILSDFMKGKGGPPGASMAKLRWEGAQQPEFPKLPKSSKYYHEFAAEYPIVASGLAGCRRSTCAAIIGAMLTLPELQSNCYRIEVLAHLAVRFADGKAQPTIGKICAWFNQLDNGTCGRQEDAAEDIFVAGVYYQRTNYRLFEGSAEGNSFYTQVFLNILEGMPDSGGFLSLKRSIEAVLKLSEEIAKRSGLLRNTLGNPIPLSTIAKPNDATFRELKRRVVFSRADLKVLGINRDHLQSFIFSSNDSAKLDDSMPGCSRLESRPMIEVGDEIIVTLPTRLGTSIRKHMIEGCINRS